MNFVQIIIITAFFFMAGFVVGIWVEHWHNKRLLKFQKKRII
jgi:hypothetical protein